MGLVSIRERALHKFKEDLEQVLKENTELVLMLDNENVKVLTDTVQEQQKLRIQLLQVADHEVDKKVAAVLNEKRVLAQKLMANGEIWPN